MHPFDLVKESSSQSIDRSPFASAKFYNNTLLPTLQSSLGSNPYFLKDLLDQTSSPLLIEKSNRHSPGKENSSVNRILNFLSPKKTINASPMNDFNLYGILESSPRNDPSSAERDPEHHSGSSFGPADSPSGHFSSPRFEKFRQSA